MKIDSITFAERQHLRRLLRRQFHCLPVFWLRGRRFRVRFRFLRSWRLARAVVVYLPDDRVVRCWLGPLFVVVMIDREAVQ